MKKKLTLLFALLCVSMMGFSIDWSGYAWLGNGGVDGKYSNKIKAVSTPELTGGAFINNLQTNSGHASIHIAMPSAEFGAISLDAADYHTEGSGFFPHLDAFKKQETEFTVVCSGTTYTFTVYYEDGEPDDLTGWNIAKGKTSVAGAYPAGYEPYRANDGMIDNGDNRWASGSGAKHYASVSNAAEDWWYVDLGGFYRVDQIKVLFETAAPTDYDLLISNNAVSWTVLGTYTGQPTIGNAADKYNVYNFTDKVGRYVKIFARNGYADLAYGISMYEFEVYGDRASISDVNPPVMGTASLSGDPLYNQVNIAVSATDVEDDTVGQFHVVDASKGVDQVCTAAAGVIAVTGLTEQTTYSFTITALDAVGNESGNNVVLAATTPADPTMPTMAAPVPSGTGKEILPIYCDAFTSILDYQTFSKNGFDNPAMLYQEKNISGDHTLVYDLSSGPKFVIWGDWSGSDNEIRAKSEYRGSGNGVDATAMEYLHIDIWSLQSCDNTINIRINDQGRGATRLTHGGGGWQSYDLPLSDFDAGVNLDNVRWFKFQDFNAVTGKLAIDNVYFWKTSTGLRSVSATPNNAEYGSASVVVKSTGLAPEGGTVVDGTEVTFSATPNDGYIFVDWSNGNTNATFNATVDAAMNLTANFRALGNIYCNTVLHSNNGGQEHDAYVTMKRSGENEYQLIVRAEYALGNFTNTEFRIKALDAAELSNYNLNNKGVLSADNHTLTGTIISTVEPEMISGKLYVNIVGQWEGQFDRLTNIEYSQPCADPEITAITLDKTEATLDMGNTLTLVPTFTPSYMSADITWQTSSDAVATVSNGVVTPVAPGSATITAKVTESIKATCSVTVQEAAAHNWYGYGTDKDLDYTYRIEYTTDHHIVAHVKRQGEKTGLVNVGMNISNVWTEINVTEGEEEGWKKGTTEATFTAGENIHIIFQSNFSGASSIIEFDYTVGSDNVMPTIVPSVLKLNTNEITMGLSDADVQLTAEIHHRDAANKTITWTSDNGDVVTVVDGLVHPVGVGTTTIHASTFNGVSESCEVTVVGELEPATFWGNGTSNGVAIAYSITRNSNHTLTYAVEALQDKEGFVVRIHDGVYHDATLNEGIYTWTSEATYIDGAVFSGFIYMPFTGGDARVDFVNYVVGSESARRYIPITVNESLDNSSVLAASDGIMRDVTVSRSFTAGNLYTLVLPFGVDAAKTAEKLPGQLTKLNNTYVKDNGDLRINFVNVSAVEAGVPYLYQPSANVTNPAFVGVSVSKDLNPTKPADNYAEYHGIYAPMDGNALHARTNAYVLGSDQYLYDVQDLPDNQEMLALRGYFVLNFPAASPGAPKRLAKVVFNSNETETTTDVTEVQTGNECIKVIVNGQLQIIRDGKTYNAFGQLVK